MRDGKIYVNKLLFLRLSNSENYIDALIQIVEDDFGGLPIISELGVGG
jgi:hypothetical protein